jgi:hypothetical protein
LPIHRFSTALLCFATVLTAADTILWEPGKVVAVEEVSTPAKEADPSCRGVPRGQVPPARCRPSNLRAQQFWRVTVETSNKRFMVRPYRAQGLLGKLNPSDTEYVDPKVTKGSAIEVAIVSSTTVRLRTDQGQGIPAIVDSQELLSKVETAAAGPETPAPATPLPTGGAPQKLWSAIGVAQPVFSLKEAGTLQLYFAVVNDGETVANPNVEASHLFIAHNGSEGSEPKDWSFVIGNGPRTAYFSALPPGQTLSFTYQLGSRYFSMPGVYTVRWEGPDYRSPEITFRVMPGGN